jgi:hypothetical protein
MKYMLMIFSEENRFQAMNEADRARGVAAYGAYLEALKSAGAYSGSERLRPVETATTVRVSNGNTEC